MDFGSYDSLSNPLWILREPLSMLGKKIHAWKTQREVVRREKNQKN